MTEATDPRLAPRERLVTAAIQVGAIVALVGFVLAALWAASQAGTLGFDFLSYDTAVRRFLAGGVLYDPNFEVTGAFGLFYYPPPFILLAIPLTLFDPSVSVWIFTAILFVSFVAGVAILPVERRVQWLVLLLGGLSWPLVYAIKLGQVGPILFLTFAIGWRWMDRPWRIGPAIALGTAIKLQPILLVGWALLTGRRRVVLVAAVVFAVLAVLATVVAGPGSWVDQISLLLRLSKPIETPHNVTAGRLVFEAGFGAGVAWAVQVANWVVIGSLVLYAILRTTDVASYLATVIATQAVSPILWDHYALMLLLPTAWLLSRRQWWSVLIPLAAAVPFVGLIPPITYPISYLVALAAVVLEGRRERAGQPATQPVPLAV